MGLKIPWYLMELRITLFLAAVFVSLALNSVIIAVLYRVLSQAEARLEAHRGRMDLFLRTLRATVEGAAEASRAAADWSGSFRDEVQDIEPRLLQASSHLGYTLAKIDFEADRFEAAARDRLRSVAKRAKGKVGGQLTEVIAIIQGARALGHLVSLAARHSEKRPEEGESAPFHSSTRKVL